MKKQFKNEVFSFQQNGAPSHASKKLNHGAQKTSPYFGMKKCGFLPPDLNPLDFSIWSMLEKDACRSEKRSVDYLKKSLQKAWADILQKKIRAAVEVFRSRLEIVNNANGGQIKIP